MLSVQHKKIVELKVSKMEKQNQRISARLTSQQRQVIEERIANKRYENLSEFLRVAIDSELAKA